MKENLFFLAFLAILSFSSQAEEVKENAFSIQLGEAFGPSGFRLRLSDTEYGIHQYSGIFIGKRATIAENYYASFGFGTGHLRSAITLAAYSTMGIDLKMSWFPWLNIYFEFIGAGNILGDVRAIGQVGIGASW